MISFFYGKGGSGEIRGRQIGEYLGARLNPTEGYEDDVCIYVKHVPIGPLPKRTYIDIVDGIGMLRWLAENHHDLGVIATSKTAKIFLSKFLKRDVIFIPEHNCNYDRAVRTRQKIETVGTIGTKGGFEIPDIAKRLKAVGLSFVGCYDYGSREDVVNFYKEIDIQVCFRPSVVGSHASLHNPLKLANACSFGIPTVAYPEENFEGEFRFDYLAASSPSALVNLVDFVASDSGAYELLSRKGIVKAENYHIERVAELYAKLV